MRFKIYNARLGPILRQAAKAQRRFILPISNNYPETSGNIFPIADIILLGQQNLSLIFSGLPYFLKTGPLIAWVYGELLCCFWKYGKL